MAHRATTPRASFASHLGDTTVPISLSKADDRIFCSATKESKTGLVHLKIVNAHSNAEKLTVAGLHESHTAELYSLHATTWNDTNSVTDPMHIRPIISTVSVGGGEWSHDIPANTIEVIDIPAH